MENKKNKRGSDTEEEIDRLSTLPDEIILYILSFLETKQALQTSVLSKKWRYMWTSIPDLNFDSRSFRDCNSFHEFVLTVLIWRDLDTTTGKFGFIDHLINNIVLTNTVVNYAVSHKVNHLVIKLYSRFYHLPHVLLMCQSLRNLELKRLILPGSFGFTKLNTLDLDQCSLVSHGGECFDALASCLNLSNLSLHNCEFRGFKILKISGSQLLKLCVTSMFYGWTQLPLGCKVEISAPKLTSFSYTCSEAVKFSLINLPCLEYVDIQVSIPDEDPRKKKASRNLLNLFRGLHNSQFVTLYSSTIQALSVVPDMLLYQQSPFHRLRLLQLKSCPDCDPRMIPQNVKNYLLNGSPNAEISSSTY